MGIITFLALNTMFAGIIQAIGYIDTSRTPDLFAVRSEILAPGKDGPSIGDSISINGVCLTVVSLEGCAEFNLASETKRCTNLGGLKVGAEVNVERSLRFGDRVDGHFVQGHVDAVSEVLSCESEAGNTLRVSLTLPEEVRGYVVPKGSIALDGVSLTVGEVEGEIFSVYLIPHTVAKTTFRNIQPGRLVNIESDPLARYVRGVLEGYGVLKGVGDCS